MTKGLKLAAAASVLLLTYACGRATGPSSSVAQSSYRSDSAPVLATEPLDPAQERLIVPPQLAVMTVQIAASHESFDQANQQIQTVAADLVQSVEAGAGCSAQIVDYGQPLQKLASSGRSEASTYTSYITIELEMALATLESVEDRMQRLDDCVGRIPDLNTDGKNEAIALSFSPILPTIRDVAIHRQALLQQHFDRLSAVAAAEAAPNQFQADETRCTSDGSVSIVARRLSGIELAVDFTCQQLAVIPEPEAGDPPLQ